MTTPDTLMVFVPYLLLFAASFSAWISKGPLWLWLAGSSVATALATDTVAPAALVALAALATSYLVEVRGGAPRYAIALNRVFLVTLSVGLIVHALPGFHNLLVAPKMVLSEDGFPYSLAWSYDKGVAGLLLLRWCVRSEARHPSVSSGRVLAVVGPIVVLAIGIAFAVGCVRFDPKLPPITPLWALSTLFVACVAEEALFRGVLQRQLAGWLERRLLHGPTLAVGITALLFGGAHLAAGFRFGLVAFVAGIAYGIAYHLTGRIQTSIVAHFLLNAVHFTFFSYPPLCRP